MFDFRFIQLNAEKGLSFIGEERLFFKSRSGNFLVKDLMTTPLGVENVKIRENSGDPSTGPSKMTYIMVYV